MAWIEPKINWREKDIFELSPDWNRITGNIEYLYAQQRPLFGSLEKAALPQSMSTATLPMPWILNGVERRVETLHKAQYPFARIPDGRIFQGNEYAWNYIDLNRIEGALEKIEWLTRNAADNRPTLQFMLGGGIVAPYI